MTPRLVILTGPLEGRVIAISGDEITIGRHASNDVVVREIAMSRHHARIQSGRQGFILRDLESRHGLSVNGETLAGSPSRHRLVHGDLIAICGSTFLFLLHEIEPEAGPLRLDDRSFLTDSALTLEATESLGLQPDSILAALPTVARRERALRVLLRAGSDLGAQTNFEDLASQLLGLALEAVPAERAVLLLAAPGGDRFGPVFIRAAGDDPKAPVPTEATAPVSQTVTWRVMRQKVALLSNDVRRADDLEGAASLQAARIGSLLCVPLLTTPPPTVPQPPVPQADESLLAADSASNGEPARSLGVLYLDDSRDEAAFDEDALQLLTALAGMAAPAVSNLQHLTWVDGERRRLQAASLDHDMIGESEAMARTLELISRVARSNTTVLVRGESGTGKELAAQAIHRGGQRRDRPFVAINCATLEGSLLESELFGHEKGAFTGAVTRKIGKLEVADTGTVFLDEIGELPLPTQAKLLRVLQEREFERVGGTRPIRIDVRVVAATNRDLESAIREGSFREDLFYRLNVIAITLPPLRQRRSDVPLLAGHFAAVHAAGLNRRVPRFSAAAKTLLERYDWPGNVRELSNCLERALVLCPDNVLRPEDLPEALLEIPAMETIPAGGYHEVLRETKKNLIKTAVREAQGNITEAAKALDIHPNYLHRLIKNLDLRPELL